MTLGFIGTGAITEAMLHGLYGASGYEGPVLVTRRSDERSARLADTYAGVTIAEDARHVVETCNTVVLAVLPSQVEAVLDGLPFREGQHLLSLAAGVKLATLVRLAGPASVQRALPMPPVEIGLGPLPVCPAGGPMKPLLSGIGEVIAVDDEHQFDTLATGSALMAGFFAMVARVAAWMESQGVGEQDAAHYAGSVFHGLASLAHGTEPATLRTMARDCLTKGGLNEQVLGQLDSAGWFVEIDTALDAILRRLEGD